MIVSGSIPMGKALTDKSWLIESPLLIEKEELTSDHMAPKQYTIRCCSQAAAVVSRGYANQVILKDSQDAGAS